MLVLITLVVIINFIYFINNYYDLEDLYYYDLEDLYFSFLEEEKYKKEKEEEKIRKEKFIQETLKTKKYLININVGGMTKIEQKIKKNNKIIRNKESTSFQVWKAGGSNLQLRNDWRNLFLHNKRLIEEIKIYKP